MSRCILQQYAAYVWALLEAGGGASATCGRLCSTCKSKEVPGRRRNICSLHCTLDQRCRPCRMNDSFLLQHFTKAGSCPMLMATTMVDVNFSLRIVLLACLRWLTGRAGGLGSRLQGVGLTCHHVSIAAV
ncbi:hypothetical protein COO60DRAFT_988399 [Scenedesmus sp. NREL 46B-D3]|nr:hypothetical protein COO60DRAFT_988399 [Scenedesmus sp. NREL 46B-D3]